MRQKGGGELSGGMLGLYLAGLALWLVYGVAIEAPPVIAANVASIVLVSAVAVLKMRAARAEGGAPRRTRIAIDMDEVMADALGEHLRRYNAAYGTAITRADLRGRHLEQYVPREHREAAEAMLDASFFAELEVMPDCVDVVRELMADYDVFIVTAAMDVPCSFDAKYRWLQRHFPFVPPTHIVFCGDKSIIEADYLIDDRARHFARFTGQGLLYSAPHNAGETRYPRVGSWGEVRAYFAARLAPAGSPAGAVLSQREPTAAI
jgi:5'(3')-deoxyribonucleotidase